MLSIFVLFFVIYSQNFEGAFACNGYQVQKQTFKNCVDNPVIKMPTGANALTFNLDSNCDLLMTGCVEITKPFKTAKGTYKIKKLPLPPVEGDMDFCEIASSVDNSQLKTIFGMFGIPTQCPFPATKICGGPSKKISVGDFKHQMGLASGNSQAKIEIEHDSGKSCIEFSVTVGKVKRG